MATLGKETERSRDCTLSQTVRFHFKLKKRGMHNQAFPLKQGSAHHWPALSWLKALLQTCLTSYQNCVKSLSGGQSSWGWHQPFLSTNVREF